ncbi:alpha ribazole-5'-P phosphatase [Roseivivax halodurans JCM 10272]|uniref:threonine-phosphate decarboxylase n=1 Tax=Roseivivax halodurans JCM 10272 TaxID=1449350 RepID=X7EEX9_9RHOB|nr:threonine-phosphate decarboxylase CobD [Roseivivax halodurans]ETX13688.1 alpha ribazole-5'-P phosphatase [Roseivivax halodurans JCM 10272]
MRDHGGDTDAAVARYGAGDWLDLSTGINARPYPMPELSSRALTALPTRAEIDALKTIAQQAYGASVRPVPLAGAQAAIQLVPRLARPGEARILGPTYNEHAGALSAAGWRVSEVRETGALEGADLAVVVNPNNPDGRRHDPARLRALSRRVRLLIVDESFADPEPEVSLAGTLGAAEDRIVVLRSFGKFYGLAGLRLGFAITGAALAVRLRSLAGPWAVSGPAIAAGCAALGDAAWQAETRARLRADAARLDAMVASAGWSLVGGTPLFRTYEVPDAAAAQDALARHLIWTRIFPYAPRWIRLGLPGDEAGWSRLQAAL